MARLPTKPSGLDSGWRSDHSSCCSLTCVFAKHWVLVPESITGTVGFTDRSECARRRGWNGVSGGEERASRQLMDVTDGLWLHQARLGHDKGAHGSLRICIREMRFGSSRSLRTRPEQLPGRQAGGATRCSLHRSTPRTPPANSIPITTPGASHGSLRWLISSRGCIAQRRAD